MRKMWICGAFALVSSAIVVACSDNNGVGETPNAESVVLPNGKTFSRKAMLEDLADCVISKQEAFAMHARAFAEIFSEGFSEANWAEAKTGWKALTTEWQRLETMAYGPLAPKTHTGGEGVRDLIYAWPSVSPCLVDQVLATRGWDSLRVDRMPIQQRGLGALEYLLFAEGFTNACPLDSAPNIDGTWADLSEADITQRRWEFAKALSSNIVEWSDYLVNRWRDAADGGGHFRHEFVNAGSSSRYYARQQRAFNVVSDALFYIESGLKDAKIANPSGLRQCDQALCPEKAESQYAGEALSFMKENLEGFGELWLGCHLKGEHDGLGFADYLTAINHTTLANDITRFYQGAHESLDAIVTTDFQLALTSELPKVHAAYDALKLITDLLRTEFVSVLDFELPTSVEGDND